MEISRQKGILCTAAARYVVEGYSPKNGYLHGSLDAEVYACAEHLQDARSKWLGKLATFVPQWTPGKRTFLCGRRTDFGDQAQLDIFAAAEETATSTTEETPK